MMPLHAGVRLYACEMLASGPGGAHEAEGWLDRYYGTADQRDDAVTRQRDGTPLTAWQGFIADTALRQALHRPDSATKPTMNLLRTLPGSCLPVILFSCRDGATAEALSQSFGAASAGVFGWLRAASMHISVASEGSIERLAMAGAVQGAQQQTPRGGAGSKPHRGLQRHDQHKRAGAAGEQAARRHVSAAARGW